jgi:hypothetical protein
VLIIVWFRDTIVLCVDISIIVIVGLLLQLAKK